MNFEFNKIAGAILGTALGVMALGIIAEVIYEPAESEKPGYVIAVADSGGTPAGPAVSDVPPIAVRLQTANAEEGVDVAKKCLACHTFDKGGPNKVGPNLWDIVGKPVIHPDNGFNYSDAMEAMGKSGMTWTFEDLDKFLGSPKGTIPGTAMAFAGLKKPEDRADVIAYLRTLSDSPVPLPAATAAAPTAPAAPAAPAAGEAPAAAPAAAPVQPESPPAAPAPAQ